MATQTEDDFAERKKKRKRPTNSPKLLVNDKVEVRSVDEGSMGSWHSAVVISLKNRARDVQYDCLLCDDGSQKLTEQIDVHPVVDGITSIGKKRLFYRGLIRPLPPPLNFEILSLHYGQCVDAYYQEAWWEGVVFDLDNHSKFRSIFFPDIGDVLPIGVDHLRITQDWDEFTEEWKPRQNWIFLDLIEQFQQENLIHVSVREIWYEVYEKEGFKRIKEWTNCFKRNDWESLVMEVIDDHSKLAAEFFFGEVSESMLQGDVECGLKNSEAADCTEVNTVPLATEEELNEIHVDEPLFKSNIEEEGMTLEVSLSHSSNSGINMQGSPSALSIDHEESSKLQITNDIRDHSDFSISDIPIEIHNLYECQISGHDIDMVPEVEICRNSAKKPKMDEGRRVDMISSSNSETTHEETPCSAQSIAPCNAAAAAGKCNRSKELDIVSEESPCDRRKKRNWEIAGTDIVPEAEFCPGSVVMYLTRYKHRVDLCSLQLSLRKHLAYLGWKIEISREERLSRMRYTSPKGKCYMSLVTVCQNWDTAQNKLRSTNQGKKTKVCAPPPFSNALISSPHAIVEPARFPEAVKYCANLIGSGEKRKTSLLMHVTPKDVQDKAKRHLRFSGWSIWTKQAGKNQEYCYTSPSAQTYNSLAAACKASTDEVNYGIEAALNSEPLQRIDVSNEAYENLVDSDRMPFNISMELVESGQVAVWEHQNEKANGNSHPLTSFNNLVQRKRKKTAYPEKKKEKKEKTLSEVSNGTDDDYTVQCSKRAARQLDSSFPSRSPLTVLSWLMDNDVVLPRTKVYYLGKKSCAPMKEGLITREGIKCNCCKTIFSLSKFQVHAGSTDYNERSAANIYLEDGRSLLSCQSQLRNRFGIKNMMTPSPQCKRRTTNDSICSACHFGGLLVLCDHCPSSFHSECLGLTEVPDGEWFCPQCCCTICRNNKFNQGSKQIMDSILNCHQCEHRYHVGCLLKQGGTNIDSYIEGKWFCNIKCKQIFLGLNKLLEKPVLVGEDNLTWTLLRYIPSNDDLDGYGTETSVETYSKLNLVVSVMHECFEPINEPGTKRDIVEDVIFSRGSDLSRLNFQGFYSVLLSRDDELITVAAVRVHGEKVAEIPLVGTRVLYRKLGMCRFLMNELEKKLMELGVERLVMPAAPSVLSTWTTSFGFSKMGKSERLKLCSYSFLDFQGAVMCEKILTVSAQPIKTLQNIHDGVGGTTDATCNKNSTCFEVSQSEKTKDVEIVNQGTPESALVSRADGYDGTLPLVPRVSQHNSKNKNQLEGGAWSEDSDNKKRSGVFRCYNRRLLL